MNLLITARDRFPSGGIRMKLNHLNLTVSNVLKTHRFLEKHFGLKEYGTLAPSEAMSFLSDDNGLVLALFRAAKGTEVKYPPGFHVGFIQESEEQVNQINQRLQEDGFKVPKPTRMHGSWTFYFQSPGGFTIEVVC
jgi:catechol 2,3-dioxygenase-like lactoylglutathione lyase family enzyme